MSPCACICVDATTVNHPSAYLTFGCAQLSSLSRTLRPRYPNTAVGAIAFPCWDAASPSRATVSYQLPNKMLGLQGYPVSIVLLGAFMVWWVALLVYTAIYNLFFHPLANIPGPKIAAATYLYQIYYSLVGGSRFYVRIKKLYEIYGKYPPHERGSSC